MSITHFPHGIFGTPNLGGSVGQSFPGLWTNRIIFVDGTNGADDQDGLQTDSAKKTLGAAVTIAGKDDTIYVRPQAVGVRYTENVTVAVTTQAGLSILGTGNGRGNSVYQSCTFKGVTGVDSPVLILNSSYANIENLRFWSAAAQTVNGLILIRWNTPVGLALNIGSSIVNCDFAQDFDHAAGSGVAQHTIRLDSTEGIAIEGCIFTNCRMAISVGSTQSATDSINIRGNQFMGSAANIAADIHVTDCTYINITGNTMGHGVPAYGSFGGAVYNKYVLANGTAVGEMTNCTQGNSSIAAATNNTLSGIICSGNKGLAGQWTT